MSHSNHLCHALTDRTMQIPWQQESGGNKNSYKTALAIWAVQKCPQEIDNGLHVPGPVSWLTGQEVQSAGDMWERDAPGWVLPDPLGDNPQACHTKMSPPPPRLVRPERGSHCNTSHLDSLINQSSPFHSIPVNSWSGPASCVRGACFSRVVDGFGVQQLSFVSASLSVPSPGTYPLFCRPVSSLCLLSLSHLTRTSLKSLKCETGVFTQVELSARHDGNRTK